MPRMTLSSSSAGGWPLAVAATVPARARILRGSPALLLVAFPVAAALAAALAAGQRDPERLAFLGLATLAAAAGAFLLGRRQRPAPRVALVSVALVAASQAATPLLGLRPSLYLLAGAATYVFYARRLEPRTPFAVVVAGVSLGSVALAGWQTAASTLRPTPLLVAAALFLWTPGHVWSLSLAAGRDSRASGRATLAAVAGVEQTAAAVFASTIGLVVASLVLAPQFAWPYAAVVVPAGACFLATTFLLRHRPNAAAASRAYRFSGAYLAALLAGVALSTL